MRILGIDPGLGNTGWGIINTKGNNLSFVNCGTIHTEKSSGLSARLLEIHNGIKNVIEIYKPDEAAIEETFVNKNAMSSLKLGHARGVLMAAVMLAGITPHEYSAKKVKKAVVGVGAADKSQVEMMVKVLLPKAKTDSYDASDALAVAICHSNHRCKLYCGLTAVSSQV